MKVSNIPPRRERKAIKKLKHSDGYKFLLWAIAIFFTPVKKFIFLPFSAARKACGVISLSIYKFFWLRIWYVDDFIIHKKLRWKGYGKKLFDKTSQEAQNEWCDYLLLFSRKDRKASHRFYKKAWLTIIGLWVGILAYKKFHKKK